MEIQRDFYIDITLDDIGVFNVEFKETVTTTEDYVQWGEWRTRTKINDVKKDNFKGSTEEEIFSKILHYLFENKILKFEIKEKFKDLSEKGFEYSLLNEGHIYFKARTSDFLNNIDSCPFLDRFKDFIISTIRDNKGIDINEEIESKMYFNYNYSTSERDIIPYIKLLTEFNEVIFDKNFKLHNLLDNDKLSTLVFSLENMTYNRAEKLKDLKPLIRKSKCTYFITSDECVKVKSSTFNNYNDYNQHTIDTMYKLDKEEAFNHRYFNKDYWDFGLFNDNKILVIFIKDIDVRKYDKMQEASLLTSLPFYNPFCEEEVIDDNKNSVFTNNDINKQSSTTNELISSNYNSISDENSNKLDNNTNTNSIIDNKELKDLEIKSNIDKKDIYYSMEEVTDTKEESNSNVEIPKFEPVNYYNDTTKIHCPYQLSYDIENVEYDIYCFMNNLKLDGLFVVDSESITVKDMKKPDFTMYEDFIYYLQTYYPKKHHLHNNIHSIRLIDFKNGSDSAYYHYLNTLCTNNFIRKFILSSNKVAICNVPSHSANKYSNMDRITDDLYNYFSNINPSIKRTNLTRTSEIQKLSFGGNRDENIHYKSIELRKDEDIVGYDILLLDDVYTTGNSLNACKRILKDNGANNVYRFTFSKTFFQKTNIGFEEIKFEEVEFKNIDDIIYF